VNGGGPTRTVILHHEPDRAQGSWGFGAGTGHHMALEVENDEKLAEQKGLYEELGYTDCSEIKDRNYFHFDLLPCAGRHPDRMRGGRRKAASRVTNRGRSSG
jgi:hypothetical protein